MVSRIAAISIASYILFLLPYMLSALTSFAAIPLPPGFIMVLVSIISAILSGLLIHGLHSIIPPITGSAASFLTNYLSEVFLGISSQVYFSWIYLVLGFLASPALAFLVVSLRAGRKVEVAVVGEVVEPAVEAVEEISLITCPACGEHIPSDSIYCPLCGSRIVEEK